MHLYVAFAQLALSALAFPQAEQGKYGGSAACDALSTVDLSSLNTTILFTTYFAEPSAIEVVDGCYSTVGVPVELCRVHFVVNTSSTSAVTAEAWLPASWNGRFLALGNGGLNGCKFTAHSVSSIIHV